MLLVNSRDFTLLSIGGRWLTTLVTCILGTEHIIIIIKLNINKDHHGAVKEVQYNIVIVL